MKKKSKSKNKFIPVNSIKIFSDEKKNVKKCLDTGWLSSEGFYVKKWVPELKNVPNKFIHKPWEVELKYQEAIKTIIGKDYPGPIVVHEKARAAALEAFQSLKKK